MLFLPAGGRNLKRDSYSQILKLKADSRRQYAGKRDTSMMDFKQTEAIVNSDWSLESKFENYLIFSAKAVVLGWKILQINFSTESNMKSD